MRIGIGFDVHSFGGNGPLVIGGVHVHFKYGFNAHSDGDVVLHALMDGLLGAIAAGDIGRLFPDHDIKYKNVNSSKLLHKIWQIVRSKSYAIGNIDITIIAQIPKMIPYIEEMRVNISRCVNCQLDQINIKATTTEKLGFIGRKEGIACEAIVLLLKV
ncbi:MAG: 2-C-methyl-D-erythritol 2,4-cyclodiphosphate synthase [Pantoea sp. Brub]|nr:2-C-methyl-D-erythritol 2,4-cyclodiphosphate synthase [Pantoea sp. Brub]